MTMETVSRKVLLTGGAGYIGSHTALEILEAGHEVEVMDNLWAGFAGLNAHIVIGAGWIAAASRGFAPAPNVPGVMAATVVVTLLAYGALKLRRRLG